MPYAADDSVAAAGSGKRGSRQAQLRSAASAMAAILDQIGPHAALVLLNASIDAVVARLKGAAPPS